MNETLSSNIILSSSSEVMYEEYLFFQLLFEIIVNRQYVRFKFSTFDEKENFIKQSIVKIQSGKFTGIAGKRNVSYKYCSSLLIAVDYLKTFL